MSQDRADLASGSGPTSAPTLLVADVGGSHIAVAGATPDGQITWREEKRHAYDPDPEVNLAYLFQALDGALARLPAEARPLLVVGVPSAVDFESGLVRDAHALGWVNLNLKEVLQERYALTALLDNDVNLASLGEAKFGAGRGVDNLVCILIGTNIGGGIIIDGRLYRGPRGAAGEIGWMVPGPAMLGTRRDEAGCLETYAGGRAIARLARERIEREAPRPSAILDLVNGDVQAIRAETVFEAARAGDGLAKAVLDEVFGYLSVTLVNIISLLDPDLILFGGGVARAGQYLIQNLRQRIDGLTQHNPPLVLSALGEDAVLYGAVALAQEYLRDQTPA